MPQIIRSWSAETDRIRRWPVAWVLFGSWVLLNLVFVYLLPYVTYRTGEVGRTTDASPEQLLAEMLPSAAATSMARGIPLFGAAIFLVLGAMAAGGGYAWGTWKTLLGRGGSRISTIGGTLLAMAGFTVAVTLATYLLDLVVAFTIATVESGSTAAPDLTETATALGSGLAVLVMWSWIGVCLGIVTRSPAMSIGLGLVWVLVVENLLRSLTGALDGLSTVTDLLPGTAAGSLIGALDLTNTSSSGTPGVLTILDGGDALLLTGAYVLVAALGTALITARRDVL